MCVCAYPRVFIGPTADFQKVNTRFHQQSDLGHCVFEAGRRVVGGVELGANAERGWDHFAAFAQDVEEEFGPVRGAAAVGVGAGVTFRVEELIYPRSVSPRSVLEMENRLTVCGEVYQSSIHVHRATQSH